MPLTAKAHNTPPMISKNVWIKKSMKIECFFFMKGSFISGLIYPMKVIFEGLETLLISIFCCVLKIMCTMIFPDEFYNDQIVKVEITM